MTAADYNLWWKTREWPWDETQVLKAGAKTDGGDAWRFEAPGYLWNYCTDPDCDDDRAHLTADGLREASAAEIQALLSEGTD
jgi:hypothetical protein